jgi:hypothetical protein
MELRVKYEDWLIGDGDEPVIVGSHWPVTLELERDGPVTDADWHPILAPSSAPRSGLWPVEKEPVRHRLVGDVVMDDSQWVGIEAGGWRAAAAGRHSGRVEGQVVLNHDTYFLGDELREFATQQVEIAAIEYRPGRYRRSRFDRGSYDFVEWGAARSVTSTHEWGTTTLRHETTELDDGLIERVGSGIFVLTCRRPA